MIRKQIYLEAEQDRAIKVLARERGVAEAVIVREAMARYLEEYGPEHETWQLDDEEDPILALIGAGPAGITDGSLNYKRDLYGPVSDRT